MFIHMSNGQFLVWTRVVALLQFSSNCTTISVTSVLWWNCGMPTIKAERPERIVLKKDKCKPWEFPDFCNRIQSSPEQFVQICKKSLETRSHRVTEQRCWWILTQYQFKLLRNCKHIADHMTYHVYNEKDSSTDQKLFKKHLCYQP